jgi:glycosyltransferase involved in cell wall biosynthesis
MACGVPVIGSDLGEIPYVMGDAGLAFPAGDPVALADRLARLRADPALCHRLSTVGSTRVATEYRWESVAERMCHVWHGLVESGTRNKSTTFDTSDRGAMSS